MNFQPLDVAAFAGFLLLVVGVSLYASRGSKSAAGYFLAGRNLPWWLIGFSLIASNISTEHFVGMAGRGYDLGLAIASYEWMAAVTLVLVGLFFLPRFLAAGIYTIPEYLEFRYDVRTRTLMAGFILAAYRGPLNGAVFGRARPGVDLRARPGAHLAHRRVAGGYTYGGLKAVVWSDLIQGVALLLGGVLVTVLGFGPWAASVPSSRRRTASSTPSSPGTTRRCRGSPSSLWHLAHRRPTARAGRGSSGRARRIGAGLFERALGLKAVDAAERRRPVVRSSEGLDLASGSWAACSSARAHAGSRARVHAGRSRR